MKCMYFGLKTVTRYENSLVVNLAATINLLVQDVEKTKHG